MMSHPLNELLAESDVNYVSPLELAIKAGDRRLVRTLIRGDGVNVNRINRKGLSPLHIAAALEDTFIVHLLVSSGAYIESRTVFLETPLLIAAYTVDNIDMVYYLLRLGANLLAKDDEGHTVKSLVTEKQYDICENISDDLKNWTPPIPHPSHDQ